MRSVGLTIALGCLVVVLVNVPMAAPAGDTARDPSKEGCWALLFQVKSDLALAPFQSGMASVQRNLDPVGALRFGIGISGSSLDAEGTGTTTDGTSVAFTGTYLRYLSGRDALRFFVGAGPEAGFARSDQVLMEEHPGDSVITYYQHEKKQHSWYVGCQALVGVEWQLTRHIALTGEYSTSADYTSADTDRAERARRGSDPWETYYDLHSETAGWSYGSIGVKLGLTIYL